MLSKKSADMAASSLSAGNVSWPQSVAYGSKRLEPMRSARAEMMCCDLLSSARLQESKHVRYLGNYMSQLQSQGTAPPPRMYTVACKAPPGLDDRAGMRLRARPRHLHNAALGHAAALPSPANGHPTRLQRPQPDTICSQSCLQGTTWPRIPLAGGKGSYTGRTPAEPAPPHTLKCLSHVFHLAHKNSKFRGRTQTTVGTPGWQTQVSPQDFVKGVRQDLNFSVK